MRTLGILAAAVLGGAVLLAAGELRAGDKEDAAKAKKHLRYVPTYEAALLEARIRNVPVFVSRQKDF